MKNSIFVLITISVLSIGFCTLAGPVVAATHIVNPTGDVDQDGDNIQAAIDAASPGDTVLLGSGTFVLGKYLDEDTTSVSTSRGSFRWFQDFMSIDIRSPDLNPWYWALGGGPDSPPFPQAIVVNKPLTIEGANPPGSTTITTVNGWLDFPSDGTLYGDANSFVVASSGVTIRNIRFDEMHYGLTVISAGTTIEDLIFDTPGVYSLRYLMDEYAAYPQFPSRNKPVKSYLRQNVWLNTKSGIHMYGSEIEATDNYFEMRTSDSTQSPYSQWAIVFGGLPDFLQIPDVLTFSECRNNLVQDNFIVGDEKSLFGAFYFAGYGSPISNNTIVNNTVENMWALVESAGFGPVENNSTVGNKVIGGPLLFSADTYGVFNYGVDEPFRDNVFSYNQFVNVSAPMILVTGDSNVLQKNHYKKSGVPGWEAGGYGSIVLGPQTSSNYILDEKFPKDTECDQVLDLGTDNVIIGLSDCE